MKLFFSKRQDARDFATKRKENGFPTSVLDKGQATSVNGSKYTVNLKPSK